MPAGSGPQIAVATAIAVSNAEVALVTLPPQQWQAQPLGLLISWSIYFTDTNAGNLTIRVRQGSGIAGANVGNAAGYIQSGIGAGATLVVSGQVQDLSAFAIGQQPPALSPPGTPGGQYTITALGSVATLGTATYALIELETIAPLA